MVIINRNELKFIEIKKSEKKQESLNSGYCLIVPVFLISVN